MAPIAPLAQPERNNVQERLGFPDGNCDSNRYCILHRNGRHHRNDDQHDNSYDHVLPRCCFSPPPCPRPQNIRDSWGRQEEENRGEEVGQKQHCLIDAANDNDESSRDDEHACFTVRITLFGHGLTSLRQVFTPPHVSCRDTLS